MIPEMMNAQPEWVAYIDERCEELDIDRYIIKALIFRESSWQSDVGTEYVGLMQISNIHSIKGNLYDPITNIYIGTDMYFELLQRYGNDVDALNRYNGIDKDGLTSYSSNVMDTAYKIFFTERRPGIVEEL